MLRGGPEDVMLVKRGGWYEKSFTGHRTLRNGTHITYPWSKTMFQNRWHLADADGACRPECRRPGYASCGSIRLGVMKGLLVRFLAGRKEVEEDHA